MLTESWQKKGLQIPQVTRNHDSHVYRIAYTTRPKPTSGLSWVFAWLRMEKYIVLDVMLVGP